MTDKAWPYPIYFIDPVDIARRVADRNADERFPSNFFVNLWPRELSRPESSVSMEPCFGIHGCMGSERGSRLGGGPVEAGSR